jgi:hypothetical protein
MLVKNMQQPKCAGFSEVGTDKGFQLRLELLVLGTLR